MRSLTLVAVSLAALAGCVTRSDQPLSKLAEGCLLNSECEAPLVCVFRRCHQPCTAGRDCPMGSDCQPQGDPPALVCTQLQCRDLPCPAGMLCGEDFTCRRGCLAASDCAQGQRCVANQCVWPEDVASDGGFPPARQPCQRNSECPQSDGGLFLACRAGSCAPQCYGPPDCATDETCTQGRCIKNGVTPVTGTRCDYNTQCADAGAGPFCIGGLCGPQCITGRDCASDQVCAQGACAPRATDGGLGRECRYTSECPTPLVCSSQGACVEQCRSDRDCLAFGSSAVCQQGECRTPIVTGTCRLNSECAVNEKCTNGRCAPECLGARDCSSGFSCSDAGACVPQGGTTATCTFTSQCPVGQKCTQSTCIAECAQSRDCAFGFVCNSRGECVLPSADGGASDAGSGTRCLYNSQCRLGEKCGPQGLCIPECTTTRDCPGGYVCDQSGACVYPPFDAGTVADGGARCLFNSQCATGERCSSQGFCIPECLTDRDCPISYTCRQNLCLPQGLPADAGLPTGYGAPCTVQSACAPNNLVCGPSGVCVYECFADVDCVTTQGQCCQQNHCRGASLCVGGADAGVRDAGTSPLDGGCRADIDCIDNDFCNGTEVCRVGRCLAGTNPCEDNNPCTRDTCNSPLRQCSYQTIAVDFDGDGRYPRQCGGAADDCDDNDATTYPGAPERCDWKDNNCNNVVDENLWRERPGSRGTVGTPGAYNAKGGPPAMTRVGSEVFLAAPTHLTATGGTVDVFKLSTTDFTLVSGPVTALQSTTSWAFCTYSGLAWGRQAVRPAISASSNAVAVTGLIGSQTAAAAACCTTADTRVARGSMAVLSPSLAPLASATLATVDAAGTCAELSGPNGGATGQRVDVPAVAWNPATNQWVSTWWDNVGLGAPPPWVLRFSTMGADGGVSSARPVYNLAPNEARLSLNLTDPHNNANVAGVGVGNRSVLFLWTNDPASPFTSVAHLRWVTYDPALTSPTMSSPGVWAFYQTNPLTPYPGRRPRIGNVDFDGTNYRVVVTSNNVSLGIDEARVLVIDEDGALVGSRSLEDVQTPLNISTSMGFVSGGPIGTAFTGPAIVAAFNKETWIRLKYGPFAGDAGLQTLDLNLGQNSDQRTDIELVPLTTTSVGAAWLDGDLKKTVFECSAP